MCGFEDVDPGAGGGGGKRGMGGRGIGGEGGVRRRGLDQPIVADLKTADTTGVDASCLTLCKRQISSPAIISIAEPDSTAELTII